MQCTVITFSITVTGNNPQPPSFNLGDGESKAVTLGPGNFDVRESVPSGFGAPTFAGSCAQPFQDAHDAVGTISAGQTLTCTISNG
jgi:hypothetical protein